MENSKKIKVSVIILSWNTKALLKQCLKSLSAKGIVQSAKLEILVVDNGSEDGSCEMIKEEFSEVRLIRNKKNLGFAKGNNIGIKEAKGEYVILLNSDTIVQKGTIEKLVNYLSSENKDCAVSPLLLNTDGSFQEDYYMKFPNLWQIFGYHNSLIRSPIMRTSFKWTIISKINKQIVEVDQLPGAAIMASKEVWKKVGLLDENYKFLYEDVDWCWRAKKLGVKLFVVPEATITHLGGGSWKQKFNSQNFEFYRQFFSSLLLFIKKNYGEKKLRIFRVALIINFLFQLKLKLALFFLKNKNIFSQKNIWV